MSLIEIFAAGRHVAMSGEALSFGASELDQIVSSYDPAVHEAPLVIGHPVTNGPAYGWVKGLARTPQGTLEARTDQVHPEFAELVRAGRYKKVSASFYRPDSPSNPKPGVYYLRHVGFLGAQPPAVKGLRPISLSEGEKPADFVEFAEVDAPTFLGALHKLLAEQLGEEEVAKAFAAATEEEVDEGEGEGGEQPGEGQPPQSGSANMSERQRARDKELEQRERRLVERELQAAQAERAARRRGNESFLESLVAQGRALPCSSAFLLSFMEVLEGAPADAVSFGEDEKRPIAQIFREDFLANLPKQVELAEVGGGGTQPEADAGAQSLADAALVYQEEQRAKGITVSTTAAVAHVKKKRGQ